MESGWYTRRFWAKSDRGNPGRIHLLEHHLADVGACFEALVASPVIRRRLAHCAGWEDIDPITASRLSVFAALHDIGKVNVGFQAQIWQLDDLPAGERRPGRAGHTLDMAPVLNSRDFATAGWFFDALGWWWEATETWDDCEGETVCGLLVAALSHHGKPLQLEGARDANPQIWRAFGELDPNRYVARIGELVSKWFPAAFDAGPALPSAPEFQHHFLGLCNLADWIGSDERWFTYVGKDRDDYIAVARLRAEEAVKGVGLDISRQRSRFGGEPDFAGLFGFSAGPNAVQRRVWEASLGERLVIVESETGSGKTEAVLGRFARMYEAGLVDRLYFALPTRAAAGSIYRRVNTFLGNLFPDGSGPEPVLAVPGYLRAGEATGVQLADYEVWWDDHVHDGTRWAAESSRRYLAAQVAVGTVDQAMLACLRVKNSHLRLAGLSRNLLVVDEVHASDTYMTGVLSALLDAHIGGGGYAVLMSATVGATAREAWVRRGAAATLAEAEAARYPAVTLGGGIEGVGDNGGEKTVEIVASCEMDNFAVVARRALEAARAGARVMVIRNTVGHSIRTQQAVEELAGTFDAGVLFTVGGVATLHHGRFGVAAPA